MLSAMHRIYFDGNEQADNERYGLWLDKSRHDLARIPGGPKPGMVVTIYEVGEIEAEATLEWNEAWDAWTARPIGAFRDNQETWEDDAHRT
jgi:hypothetical protein